MILVPKTKQEAEDLVFHVFLQGDMRNFDGYYFDLLADFIINRAINIEKEVFSLENEPLNSNIKIKVYGAQQTMKINALKILKIKNLDFKGFEMPFLDYKTDILASKDNKTILIECGPCRLWKAINYLEEGAELWVTRDDDETELFIITRGENWDSQLKEFNDKKAEQLKKIKSPIDTMMENKEKNEKE